MMTSELLALMDREAQTLADENNHLAAALMREAAATIRKLTYGDGVKHAHVAIRLDTGPEEMFRRQNPLR